MPVTDDIGQFLASIPAFVGFYPDESLIVIHLYRSDNDTERPGLTLRLGLPDLAGDARGSLEQISEQLRRQPAGRVIAVVVSRQHNLRNDLPFRKEMDVLADTVSAADHSVRAFYFLPEFTEGVRFRCYCPLPECGGVLPDPATSPGALAAVAAGSLIRPNRQSVEDLFKPAPADELASIDRAVHQAADRLSRNPLTLAARLGAFDAAIPAAGEDAQSADAAKTAELLAYFASPLFRDACVVPEDGAIPELERINLLLRLHRLAPAELRQEVGTALATAYSLLGESFLSGMAAESIRPRTRLANFLIARANGELSPDIPRGQLSDFIRRARNGAVNHTRTVGAETEKRPVLFSLVKDSANQVDTDLDRSDYPALRGRLEKIDEAVRQGTAQGHPAPGQDVADIIAGMNAPHVRSAALVSPGDGSAEADRLELFRLLSRVCPLDYAPYVTGALAYCELATGNLDAALDAASAVDPPSILGEAVRQAIVTGAVEDLVSMVSDVALAGRFWLGHLGQA